MRVGERVTGIHQLDQPCSVDMGVNLRGRNVSVAEKRLKHAEIGASCEQVRGESVTKHMRADSVGRNPCVRGHLPNQLEKPHPA